MKKNSGELEATDQISPIDGKLYAMYMPDSPPGHNALFFTLQVAERSNYVLVLPQYQI